MRIFPLITLLIIALSPSQVLAEPETPKENTNPNEFASRGQLLYQNHCTVCHESNVHIRGKRKAKNVADINKWVNRWAQHRKLDWSEKEIKDVVQFINAKYYKYTK